MDKDTLRAIIEALFELLQRRFVGRPLIQLLLPLLEAVALSLLDQLLARMLARTPT